METFHFLRPLWFLALIPAAWLLITLWRSHSAGATWQAVFDRQLLSRLWLESPGKSARLPLFLLAAGWLLTVIILAGPVWERQPEPVWHSKLSRIVILDLSASMDARDLSPSRLERARFKIMDILERSKEGRTGLVVFAGEPHIVTPLTEDTETIKNLIGTLRTDIVPAEGDSVAPALQMATELLDLKGIVHGELLLITDGIDDPAAALSQARQLREQGHSLSILGVGTDLGGAIMRNGVAEVIRFNATALQELSRAGGGVFSRLTSDDTDLNRLLPEISATSNFDPVESDAGGIERWVEHGVWLMPLIVLLAAIAFRRGWLLGFAVFFIMPPPAQALSWQDLWLRADQQAQKYLRQGDPQTAAQQFRDANWRGTALYEAGEYEAAAQAFAESDDPEARYNQGNALARSGDLQQAIDAYREVLKQNPGHVDAKANLELLEKLLQNQQQQGDESSQQDEEGKQQEKNSDASKSEDSADQQQEEIDNDNDNENTNNTDKQNADETSPDLDQNNGEDETPPDQQDLQEHLNEQTEQNDQKQDEQQDAIRQEMPGPDEIFDENDDLPSEADIALEQWLRQIPEDPSGLLRRKFMLEHMQRKQR